MVRLETKEFATALTKKAKSDIELLVKQTGITPSIRIVCIGNDAASKWYNKSIEKISAKVGIKCTVLEYEDISLEDGIELVRKLSGDNSVHGILINQPFPRSELSELTEYIVPEKDIEGVSAVSFGRLALDKATHLPCTPLAVMELIKHYDIALKGKKVVVLGRSNIVGKPLSLLITRANATVTLCHSKTRNIEKESRGADILVAAIGRARLVTKEWVNDGAIVIDVGTNYSDEGLCGDVDFDDVSERVSMISPVPFGVGSLTNLMLVSNIIDAYKRVLSIDVKLL